MNNSYVKLVDIFKFSAKEKYDNYLIKSVVKEIKADKEYNKKMNEYYGKLFNKYHFLRNYVFKKSSNGLIRFPVNLYRLINSVKNTFSLNTLQLNLNPIILNKSHLRCVICPQYIYTIGQPLPSLLGQS